MNTADAAHAVRTRPTVICLHASGQCAAQWWDLSKRLREDFIVSTPDLYGHGSAPAWQEASGDIVSADADRIARIAGSYGRVHLVGHAYGAAIALRVALLRPALVASVAVYEPLLLRVLLDHNRRDRAAAELLDATRAIGRDLKGTNRDRAASRFIDYWAGSGTWARLWPGLRAQTAAQMVEIHAHMAALFRDSTRLHDLRTLGIPVLYLMGRQTRLAARRIGELATHALPRVQLDRLDGMGHFGPVTHADIVAERTARFLRAQSAATQHDRKAA